MSAVFDAHLRLLATLPVRTHTHRERPYVQLERHIIQERRRKIRALLAQGTPQRRIAVILRISRTAIQKHIAAIKRGR